MLLKGIRVKCGHLTIKWHYLQVLEIAFLVILNSLAVKIPVLSFICAVCEMAFLIFLLICRPLEDFTITMLILVSVSIENQMFALGSREITLYSIYNLPVVRGYLFLLVLFTGLLKSYKKKWISIGALRSKNGYHKFLSYNILMFFLAFPMVAITLITNDNGMLFHTDMWRYIARDAYEMICVISIICLVCNSLERDEKFVERLKSITVAVLTAVTWGAVVLVLLGNYYSRWGDEYYITCPLILFFAPGLILFLFEENGILNLVTGVVSLVLQLRFTVGIAGTWWIYVFAVMVLFIRRIISFRGSISKLPLKMFCLIGMIVGASFIISTGRLTAVSGQITYKLSSILSMLGRGRDFQIAGSNIGGSISTRVEEMVSALIEVLVKPYFIPFGKGFGGTALHWWGTENWNISGSTFADTMIKYKTYSAFHVPIAEIIVNFGLVGILFMVFMLREFIDEFLKKEGNAFILIGVLWFFSFYSLYYSFNLGLAWLCLGLYIKYGSLVHRPQNNS